MAIRPFEEHDYDAAVRISNAIFPDQPSTVEEWRYDDEHFDRSRYVLERYVAEDPSTGEVVGLAAVRHIPWSFHPQRFEVNVRVPPDHQRRGIGTRLWERVVRSLEAHEAIAARTQIRENMDETVRFAAARGFTEVMRTWESRLAVAACDLSRFAGDAARAAGAGIEVTTLAEERARDPRCLPSVFALDVALSADVPQPDAFTPVEFRMWLEYAVDAPWAIPEAFFLAVAGGDYVGMSNLYRPKVGDWLNQGLTGVRRGYRGRGIATALKVKTVEFAAAQGVREIRTNNEIHNARMIAINDRFGFVRQPAWVTYAREFQGPKGHELSPRAPKG